MKASEFFWRASIQVPFGVEPNRIVKIISALRSQGADIYPSSKKRGDPGAENHVTAMHAANVLFAMAINANPFNKSEFKRIIKNRLLLRDKKGRYFFNQIARALTEENAGVTLDGQRIIKVTISLDRAGKPPGSFAEIHLEDASGKISVQEFCAFSEEHCQPEAFERLAVIQPAVLQAISGDIFDRAYFYLGEVYNPISEQKLRMHLNNFASVEASSFQRFSAG